MTSKRQLRDRLRKTKIISITELYPREILRNRLTKIVIRSLTKEPFVEVNSNMSSKERQKKGKTRSDNKKSTAE